MVKSYIPLLLILFFLIPANNALAQTVTNTTTSKPLSLAATYESISVYASFSGDDNANNSALLEWRKVGDTTFKKGMAMSPDRRDTFVVEAKTYTNPYTHQWRASVLGVSPNVSYEIKVTFSDPDGVTTSTQTATITTRNDIYPSTGRTLYVSTTGNDTSGDGSISNPWKTLQKAADNALAGDTVIVKPGTYSNPVVIAKSGTATNFIYFRPETLLTPDQMKDPVNAAKKVVLDGSTATKCGDDTGTYSAYGCAVAIRGSYIRFGNFEINGGMLGAKIYTPAQYTVFENNWIHNLITPEPTALNSLNAAMLIGNSFSTQSAVANITVQGNLIESAKKDPGSNTLMTMGTSGGMVIRNNKIVIDYATTTTGLHGTDCTGGPDNYLPSGGYFKDSDVYNNICDGATDDAIEIDGGNMNVRVWGNTIRNTNLAFSVAPVIYGPVYIFRNTVENLYRHWAGGCTGVKTGRGSEGYVYIYQNTFYLGNSTNCNKSGTTTVSATIAAPDGGIPDSKNIFFRNNIMHSYDRVVSGYMDTAKPNMDYDLVAEENTTDGVWAKYANITYNSFSTFKTGSGQEAHGLEAKALFINPVLSGDFHLQTSSPGIDKGVVLTGFNDVDSSWPYQGVAPDIGAFESGVTGPKLGDINGDGKVDITDYNLLVTDFGKTGLNLVSDLDKNGKVDIFDYNAIIANFGK